MTDFDSYNRPSHFEQFVNPAIGELIRRIGLDKSFVWGKGCYLKDEQGVTYLDFVGAYGALPFGHSPDDMLEVLASFRDTCEPVFVQPSSLIASGELAARLLEIAPGKYRSVTFQNSGAETVEAAIKACIAATGRRRILSTHKSFHGKTLAALSATGSTNYQEIFCAPLEGFDFVDYGDAAAVHAALAARPQEYAAVIVEPIQGEGGVNVPPDGYLAGLRAACDEFGALLIVDEVQTGLGRTGRLFAIEKEGVQADCLLLAKALGGGVAPIGACLISERAYTEGFQRKHSSTFGGNTLACRVGLQVLKRLMGERETLLANVSENGAYLLKSLRALATRHNRIISDVRGEGYLIGVEFDIHRGCFEQYFGSFMGIIAEQENLVPLVASYLLNVEHIRVAPTLNGASTMRIEPPLIATRAECDRVLVAFERVLNLISAGNTGELVAHLLGGEVVNRVSVIPQGSSTKPDANVPRFGFLLHPLELKNYAEYDESFGNYSEHTLGMLEERLGELMDPFYVSTVRLKSPFSGQVVEGDFIMVPRSAAQLAAMPLSESTELIESAMQIAIDRGARLIGLGGHTSIVTGGGLRVTGKGIPVTTGNTYTMLTAVEAACAAIAATGRDMADVRVAVVGATGSIGSAIARLIAAKASHLTLVGNPKSARFNQPRFAAVIGKMLDYATQQIACGEGSILAKLADRLGSGLDKNALVEQLMAENGSRVSLIHSNALEDELRQADLVLVATSSTERFIKPELLKRGAIICDISRPANVSHEIARTRSDVLVVDGGIVEAPGRPLLGSRFGIPEDLSYACMAETMMLALEGAYRDTSLGIDLDNGDLELIQTLASKHGFRLTGFRSFDKALDSATWAAYAAQFGQAAGKPLSIEA